MACSGLGARLFRVRKEAGLGLIKLGKMAGVSHSSIGDIEKGRQLPAVDTVERLARTLQVSPAWLAYGMGSRELHLGRETSDTDGFMKDPPERM